MRNLCVLTLLSAYLLGVNGYAADGITTIDVDGKALVNYQAKPMANPPKGDKFKGSNFFHPLRTPSGFVVTDCHPGDHPHHFGLWWPWKYIETEGRKVLCWELQKGDGIIEAKESALTDNGLTAKSVFIDRKSPGGPAVLLNETLNVTASKIIDSPARGYFLDLEITHEVAGKAPITVTAYRYSGFAIRGTPFWSAKNSSVLTSEGKTRYEANFSRGRWVRVEGKTDAGGMAGVLLMSRRDNRDHPEKLRTWDKQHGGAIFINFNTVMEKPWVFEPGKAYSRNYRVFVYDGEVSAEEAEALWKAYQ